MANKNTKTVPLEKRDNSIGIESAQRRLKSLAIQTLQNGKIMEKNRSKMGYLWIHKEKTTKQIDPKNLKGYLKENWILLTKKCG